VLDRSSVFVNSYILRVKRTIQLKDQIQLDHITEEYVCCFQSFGKKHVIVNNTFSSRCLNKCFKLLNLD